MQTNAGEMIEIIRRTHRWAVKDNMLDQMRQPSLTGPTLGNEATFIPHQHRDTRLAAMSRKDRVANAVAEATDYGSSPIG